MPSTKQWGGLLVVAVLLAITGLSSGVAYAAGRVVMGSAIAYIAVAGFNQYKRGKATA